jgi:hypothetical protein
MGGRPVADDSSYANGATTATYQAPRLLPSQPFYRVQNLRPKLGQLISHAEQESVGRDLKPCSDRGPPREAVLRKARSRSRCDDTCRLNIVRYRPE